MKLPKITHLFHKPMPNAYLAVDLGTNLAKVALFESGNGFANAQIKGIGTQVHGKNSLPAGQIRDLDAVIETVDLAIEEAQLRAGVSSTQLILGLSTGMIYAQGLRVRIRRQDPERKLDEAEFDALAQQIEEQTLLKSQAELEKIHLFKLERVETVFTLFELDGAKVKSPLGLVGKDLEIAVLHYFLEPDKLRLVNSLAQQLGLEIVSLVGTGINLAVSELETYPDQVLIDLGGDLTEIVITKAGKVAAADFFWLGSRDFTDQISQDLHIAFDQAEAIKLNFIHGHLDHDRALQVKKSLGRILEIWVEGVAVTLKNLTIAEIPLDFLLSGQSRHLPLVKSSLSAYPWMQKISIAGFPKLQILKNKYPGLEALVKMEL